MSQMRKFYKEQIPEYLLFMLKYPETLGEIKIRIITKILYISTLKKESKTDAFLFKDEQVNAQVQYLHKYN